MRHYTVTRLWDELERRGSSMAWLARRTGYSQAHVGRLRRGRFPVTEKFARLAAAALDMEIDSLFLPIDSREDDDVSSQDETPRGKNGE